MSFKPKLHTTRTVKCTSRKYYPSIERNLKIVMQTWDKFSQAGAKRKSPFLSESYALVRNKVKILDIELPLHFKITWKNYERQSMNSSVTDQSSETMIFSKSLQHYLAGVGPGS